MALTKKKKIINSLVFFVMAITCALLGQALGSAAFLKLTSISFDYYSLDSLYRYWIEYRTDSDIIPYLKVSGVIAIVITLVPWLILIAALVVRLNKEEIHGSARWADDVDLQKSGLFPTEHKSPALLLGKMNSGEFKGRFVELVGQTFVGVSAPTGSGKGIGFVLPNLVNYSDSIVCLDIKLENFIKSGGFRQKSGQEVFLFSPDGYAVTEEDRQTGTLRSHRYNPYHYVRRQEAYRVGDTLILANTLYPNLGGKDSVWSSSSAKLFLGLSLWMLDTETRTGQVPTLPYLLKIVGIEGGLTAWMKRQVEEATVSDECLREFNTFLTFPKDTQGSILTNFTAPLGIYSDSTVAKAVSGNDFDFRDLRKKGISLYVGVQPPNKKRFEGLLNLFFEQLINENTRVTPEVDTSLTYQLLALLDEFPALGRVNQIKESIGFTRQYNLRFALIYQDKSQLEDNALYGKSGAENIISNLVSEVIYPPKKVTQRVKEISESLGYKTVKVKSNSVNKGQKLSKGESTNLQRRALMMPHELVELGYEKHAKADIGTRVMMFKENQRGFIMDKLISFDEPVFVERIEYSKQHIPSVPLL
ncbi:conjugal transfer protein TraK [Vibrio cyclitrophicus 1F175]|uniref:type IV secretory system conjugative DNA transfer family protein n=1 Tax=Vibrio TaxID=662 RepID=UPI0003130075|nr:type IV secretory system conjugative DNA transfer family protein [Vibrio cyclitrophicus]OEF63575.1 conjugal transfer protein TraK [Vibrio cyclitrophicus 1F175]